MNNQPDVFRKNIVKVFSLLAGASMMLGAIDVTAHGYVSSPKGRAVACRDDGPSPETPRNAACKAAFAAGNAAIYEPWSINVIGADNNHQALIPDGKLCSAGHGDFGGLDLARNDWPATQVSAGPRAFIWTNTAQHRTTYFRYYITKQGFNPLQPLKWSDLEQIHQSGRAGNEATSTHVVTLPARTGRHIVYSVWQRDKADAPEGFYQCVDVIYSPDGNSSSSVSSSSVVPGSSSTATTSRSSSSISDNACANLSPWNANTQYNARQEVVYNGRRYSANYWTQGNNPAETSGQYNYWSDMGPCSETTSSQSSVTGVSSSSSSSRSAVPSSSSSSSTSASGNCTSPVFASGASYAAGALVQNGGSEYRCTVGGWCSLGGAAYSPGTGWAWTQAWTLVRSCQ
ncbi:MAG TPA: lytic polysaccharide monooxygenase [Cellvibrio sp.]